MPPYNFVGSIQVSMGRADGKTTATRDRGTSSSISTSLSNIHVQVLSLLWKSLQYSTSKIPIFMRLGFVLTLSWIKLSTPPVLMLLGGPILERDIPEPELSSQRTHIE